MVAAFSPLFITLYIYRLPLEVSTRVFEAFIIDGELALRKILYKMLSHKKKNIMAIHDERIIEYVRTDLAIECFNELTIEELVNY
mmetsp:Transcript_2452/g.2404  ORF Transcript_2452/g.2404 Transcript_2452/m.2404 type:complete len:85 (-) Transcript_2452:66-320(-)